MIRCLLLIMLSLQCWTSLCAQTPQKIIYTYDALNRLTAVMSPNGSKITYNYDVLGNRTSVVQTATCQAPTSFNPAITATNSATLSWGAVSGATGYRIQYRPTGFTSWSGSFTIAAPTTAIGGIGMGGAFQYQVETVCSGGITSGFSPLQSFTTTCLTPTATLSGSQTISPGQTATLTAAVTGGGSTYPYYSVGLSNGELFRFFNLTTPTASLTVSPTATTTYTLVSVSNSCATGTVSGSATVTVDTVCASMYSLRTGNWNDPATWSCGRVPVGTDVITIKPTHTVSIPATYTAKAQRVVYEGGTIQFAANTGKLCLGCSEAPTAGLVAYYTFSGNANDESGTGNNGTVNGAAPTTDRFGNANAAYSFDGVDDYIEVSNSSSLNFSTSFSASFWSKMSVWADGNNIARGIISKKPNDGSSGYVFYKDGFHQNKINFRLKGSSAAGDYMPSNSNVTINVWEFWSMSYNATSGQVKLYKNGALDKEYNNGVIGDLTNNVPLHIGRSQTWSGHFSGSLDDIRIYNRALTDAEVQAIYSAERY